MHRFHCNVTNVIVESQYAGLLYIIIYEVLLELACDKYTCPMKTIIIVGLKD